MSIKIADKNGPGRFLTQTLVSVYYDQNEDSAV